MPRVFSYVEATTYIGLYSKVLGAGKETSKRERKLRIIWAEYSQST